jgi:hypothetical protein
VTGQRFGGRIHDDVGAVFERVEKVGRSQCIVHNKRNAVPVGDFSDGLDIRHRGIGVGNRLHKYRPGFRPDRFLKIFGFIRVFHDIDPDAEFRENLVEAVHRPSVKADTAENPAASSRDIEQRVGDRGHTGSQRNCTRCPVQRRHPLLKDRNGGITYPCVKRRGLREGKKPCGALRIPQLKRRRLIDRHGDRIVVVRCTIASPQFQRIKTQLLFI